MKLRNIISSLIISITLPLYGGVGGGLFSYGGVGGGLLPSSGGVGGGLLDSIYSEVKTPYKYGMIVVPEDTHHQVDCPTVFREGNKWYMTYVKYNGKSGLDGRGYTTWIAESDDLLHWNTLGCILDYKDSGWDMNQRGGFPSLIDWEWGGSYRMNAYKNKYWMTYIGGEGTGYEGVRAPLNIGMAWGNSSLPSWLTPVAKRGDAMLLSINDKDVQWWEKLIQYKSTIYDDKAKTLGKRFIMFYNAGGINPENNLKAERIGIALSNDMKKWERYAGNPVFTHEAPGIITGDAQIVNFSQWAEEVKSEKIKVKSGATRDPLYVMFYFSAYNPARKYNAYNTFAVSRDLVHWQEWEGPDLVYPTKDYDAMFAHKSYVLKHNGIVYHFYCAVNNEGQRGIAVATSKPMGKSPVSFPTPDPKGKRTITNLNDNWTSQLIESNYKDSLPNGRAGVGLWGGSLPHNWDDYYGYRQLKHGNLHGTAIYERQLDVNYTPGKRYFLQFEGIGTYATVILNNDTLCRRQPVGRTTYTLDITEQVKNFLPSSPSLEGRAGVGSGRGGASLKVIAHHPEMITDMPWVCGGCSAEWGFSEGSQPLGIYRPVSLIETDEVRIEPFGVHVWNNSKCDTIFVETEVKNYSDKPAEFEVVNNFNQKSGKRVFRLNDKLTLQPGETRIIRQQSPITAPTLWSLEDPYLYNVVSMIKRADKTTDQIETPYGIRTVEFSLPTGEGRGGAFLLNGKRVFINGTCEYEHLLGGGHAFSPEQIKSRIKQIRQAGFNAYREAHQPHNLLYQQLLDREGMLFWSQFSAHAWYDTPQFRENFKTLLRQWIKERRNSPSIILWGIQNESTMPKDFTEECAQIIREMDPMCSLSLSSPSLEGRVGVGSGRLTTTCNGGEGSDWNVIQNWSGTYGGTALNYDTELKHPNQLLNGEYGAWRTVGLHSEAPLDSLRKEKSYSEERATDLLETKVRLAEEVKDSVCGHFQWLFATHDNPGRVQPDEAYRMADKIGPINYKGLLTVWEQPTDAYYMYRSNYVSPDEDPMVYIVSHTWADRFVNTGARRCDLAVYSNCDSVLLYNSADESVKLGRKKNARKPGTHMLWENRLVQYNVLRAVGYRGGKAVAEDIILLNNLPEAPGYAKLYEPSAVVPSPADNNIDILKPQAGRNYVARINCGGDSYTDTYGNTWLADNTRYSHSWGEQFGNTDADKVKASQGVISEPIRGTRDWPLFQSFRYGRHKLIYDIPVPNGKYSVDLYFAEPWLGTGGGITTDCEGERLFSVAINGKTVATDIDLWAEAGHAGAYKRTVEADVTDGKMIISFPEVKVGQAIVCAIAISTNDSQSSSLSQETAGEEAFWARINADKVEKLPKDMLPSEEEAFPAIRYDLRPLPSREGWGGSFTPGVAKEYALRFRYKSPDGAKQCQLRIIDQKGSVLVDRPMTFPQTPNKFKTISTTTATQINAGNYRVQLIGLKGVDFEYLEVQ